MLGLDIIENVESEGDEMQKILFCNMDLLFKGFNGFNQAKSKENRDLFLQYVNELSQEDNNIVYFVSRDEKKLYLGEEHFKKEGYTNFFFKRRDHIRAIVDKNRSRNNCFVFISGKEVDFHVAVNCKALFIVPTWIPTEDKAKYYGVHVDTPEQLAQFIRTLNNHNCVFEELNIEPNVDFLALVDARYRAKARTLGEREMLIHFENILKKGQSRNYYAILMYHFLAGMTRTNLLDDVELFGMIPSSNGFINPDMFSFMTQTRLIKGKRLPSNALYQQPYEQQNLLIRHTQKQKAHEAYGFQQRATMGCSDEFATLCINPAFRNKINKLSKTGNFNVCIFDDYVTHGNSFNAVRSLLKNLGANKIIFISLGSFAQNFQKNDYEISGDVFTANYTWRFIGNRALTNAQYNTMAKDEIDALYNIFNS